MTRARGEARRGGSGRYAIKRAWIVVNYDGQEYVRDLAKCRLIVAQRAIEGDFDTQEQLAKLAGLNPNTVQRWLSGATKGNKQTTMRILARLRLDFHDVHELLGSLPHDREPRSA